MSEHETQPFPEDARRPIAFSTREQWRKEALANLERHTRDGGPTS